MDPVGASTAPERTSEDRAGNPHGPGRPTPGTLLVPAQSARRKSGRGAGLGSRIKSLGEVLFPRSETPGVSQLFYRKRSAWMPCRLSRR